MAGGGGGGGGGNGGEHKSGPRTTTSNESEEMAAMKAERQQMKAKIKQMEAEMQQMKEAANKVMDSHEAQQLTSHLAALQQQQPPILQNQKYMSDLSFETARSALNLAAFLGMSEDYARTVNDNGERMMQREIERLHHDGKLKGDPWNYFMERAGFSLCGREEVLEHWNYVVHETASEKEYPNGTRDQDRPPMNLDDFMQCPEVTKAKLSRAQVIALRLYTTLIYKYVNWPLRDKKYFRTFEDQPDQPRHPLAAVVWHLQTGLKQLREVVEMRLGEQIVLWRGMKHVNCVPDVFMENGGAEPAPMSTSRDMKVALGYGTDGVSMQDSVLYKIVARNDLEMGADIQWLSAFPQEAEVLYPPLTFLVPAKKETLQRSGIALIEMTANLSSGLGLVSGASESKVPQSFLRQLSDVYSNAGFVVGMQVCVLERGALRDGEVTSMSAKDGVTVKYADDSEDNYVPTKLKKMMENGVKEKEARFGWTLVEDKKKRNKKKN